MEIDHALDYVVDDLELLFFCEFGLFYVQLIIKTAVLHELCDQKVFVHCDAEAHVQDDIGMLEVAKDMDLLHKLLTTFVTTAGFHVILYGYWALHESASWDLTIAPFTDHFNDFNVFLFDNEVQALVFSKKLIKLPYFLRRTINIARLFLFNFLYPLLGFIL